MQTPPSDAHRQKFSIKTMLHSLRSIPREMLLSHHPVCERYKDHTFTLFGKRFCIGCFIGYPSAIIGIIVGTILIKEDISYADKLFWVAIIGLSFIVLSFSRLSEVKPVKMIQKGAIGAGSGLLLTYFFYAPGPLYLRIIFVVSLAFMIFMIMNILHIKKHEKICRECPYKPGFGKCPGYPQPEPSSRSTIDKDKGPKN